MLDKSAIAGKDTESIISILTRTRSPKWARCETSPRAGCSRGSSPMKTTKWARSAACSAADGERRTLLRWRVSGPVRVSQCARVCRTSRAIEWDATSRTYGTG